jgi:transcriptional regulator with XRE-family HTH domain
MEGLYLMVDKIKRQRFGKVVKEKRKRLGFDQLEFGRKIWDDDEEISPSALQTRVSRLERGDYWPPKDDLMKIVDQLNIWDEAFAFPETELKAEGTLFLDPACEAYVPSLSQMVKMMSDFAKAGDATHFYQILNMLCDVARSEEKKASNGDP